MDPKETGQAGLEYLMTYGWALIVIATIIGALVFVFSPPSQENFYSSSDPGKIMVKSGSIQGNNATVAMQNITGGKITITAIATNGECYSSCTINGQTNPEIPAGTTMQLNCPLSCENATGTVKISYTDFAKLQKNVSINIAGGTTTNSIALMEPYCIDMYEASHSDATYCANASPWTGNCQNSYGTSSTPASVPDRIPWVNISQTAASTACQTAGKYLCSSEEWMAAANLNGQTYNLDNTTTQNTCIVDSTLYCLNHSASDGEACNTGTNKNTSPSNCKSTENVYDLIGNVWEWTNDVIDINTNSIDNGWNYPNDDATPNLWGNTTPSLRYGNDGVYTSSTKTGRAVLRGGAWGNGGNAGLFSVSLTGNPSSPGSIIGFRCCKKT